MAELVHVDEWTGEGVSVSEIEHELALLRAEAPDSAHGPQMRTSVMTHMAWVPEDWLSAALETLAGLAERHPSRTLVLVPDPDGPDRLDAELSLRCFPLEGAERHVCTEVIELRLRGNKVLAPASIVEPLLIADLPVFLRWRGQLPFGAPELEQLVGIADRLVVDSVEWDELPDRYRDLAGLFDHTAVSDIAWSRTLPWRAALAHRWPDIAEVRRLTVAGPWPEALLLAGWLRSRLGHEIELEHELHDELEAVSLDGEESPRPPDYRSASDLLSEELDVFTRDRVYESAVRRTY